MKYLELTNISIASKMLNELTSDSARLDGKIEVYACKMTSAEKKQYKQFCFSEKVCAQMDFTFDARLFFLPCYRLNQQQSNKSVLTFFLNSFQHSTQASQIMTFGIVTFLHNFHNKFPTKKNSLTFYRDFKISFYCDIFCAAKPINQGSKLKIYAK